ncbi:glycosyl hydrolase family 28 protein [Thermophagus sp. OGC60D27]|uniref:glycosyl hydrolase family 28 protein n=1 Tax=Thermophagus sp. OGC60D27 TaxID=3458415 RepID=UPI004037C703
MTWKTIALITCIAASTCISCDYNSSKISKNKTIVYPKIKNLETVDGLERSPFFSLEVNNKNAFVYRGFETREEHEWYGDAGTMTDSPSYKGVSFCNFSFSGQAKIAIRTSSEIEDWEILPNIPSKALASDSSIMLTIDTPRKFLVKAKLKNEWQFFIISAEAPETMIPDKNDPNVLFMEPGIHEVGQAWDPFTNGINTLYVSGGAVVKGTVKVLDKENIRILGRGLFSQAFVRHAEETEPRLEQEWDSDWMGFHFGRCKNIEVNGIAVINSPGYQMEFADCDDVKVKNVKLLGFGEHNNDGFHTYGRNITLEDCFVTANDDRVCITGLFDASEGTGDILWDGTNKLSGTPVANINIKNMIFWGLHNNGADIMLTWNGQDYCKDVTIENCYSLSPTNKAFIASMHGGSAIFSNIKIRNCYLNHGNLVSLLVRDEGYQGAGGGSIKNLTFENIQLNVNKSEIGKSLYGFSQKSNITKVSFRNIKANNGVVKNLDETGISSNEFVSDINAYDQKQ